MTKAPLVDVVTARMRVGSCIGMYAAGTPKFHFWSFKLSCSHVVERRCRYERGGAKGWARIWHGRSVDEMLPPPRRVRCEECAAGKPRTPSATA